MSKEREIAEAVFQMLRIYNQTAMSCVKNKRFEDAIKAFKESLKLQESFRIKQGIAQTHFNISNTYVLLNRLAEAKEHLEKSKGIFSEMGKAEDLFYINMTLARICMLEKKENEALVHFMECTKFPLFKKNRDLLEMLDTLLIQNGDYLKAIEMQNVKIENIILTRQDKAETYIKMAMAYEQLHDHGNALICLDKSLPFLDDNVKKSQIISEITIIRKLTKDPLL